MNILGDGAWSCHPLQWQWMLEIAVKTLKANAREMYGIKYNDDFRYCFRQFFPGFCDSVFVCMFKFPQSHKCQIFNFGFLFGCLPFYRHIWLIFLQLNNPPNLNSFHSLDFLLALGIVSPLLSLSFCPYILPHFVFLRGSREPSFRSSALTELHVCWLWTRPLSGWWCLGSDQQGHVYSDNCWISALVGCGSGQFLLHWGSSHIEQSWLLQ